MHIPVRLFICSNALYILHIINILMHDLNICGIINVTVLKHEAVAALIRLVTNHIELGILLWN